MIDAYHRKAARKPFQEWMLHQIQFSCTAYSTLLAFVQRLERIHQASRTPGFDLDKIENSALLRDDIDLPAARPIISFHYGKTPPLEVIDGNRFPHGPPNLHATPFSLHL